MTAPQLAAIRNCLEGIIPSILATVDAGGVPNVSMISQVQYVDADRVALSYQFFNKTRRNLLATRCATVAVVDPDTNAQYLMTLDYIETQTSGPLFEAMRAKLAGLASHSGMRGVFRLLGSDLFRVRAIEILPSRTVAAPARRNLLAAARRTCEQLAACDDLGALFDTALAGLQQHFGIEHAMALMIDRGAGRLYTVASRGYPATGIGAEVGLGEGVIGVAAAQGVAIRIGHMSSDYSYGAAVGDRARSAGLDWDGATAIPYPGLEAPQSQAAIPILQGGRTIGVLFAEGTEPNQFGYDEEDALAMVAGQLAATMALLQAEDAGERPSGPSPAQTGGREIRIRRYAADNSVFVDDEYMIKGVAGAILWKLAAEHAASGRVEFTNRELRLDPDLRLPEFADNLEARLVLLQRRLSERNAGLRIERCGRGRFRLVLGGRLTLRDLSG